MPIGAIAPETKPVRFFLNGEYYGPFVVTERFDERFFAAHWGYDDILLSQDEMNKLWEWVETTRPLTMANVSQHVNIDNRDAMVRCGGVYGDERRVSRARTVSRPDEDTGGWFWVNWDMDQSFRDWNLDSYQYLLERVAEGRRGRNPAEPRSVILSQLIAEDPLYRDYLKRVVQKALNHQLTQAFLMERYEHYLTTATQLQVRRLDYLPRLRQFLERRRDFFRLTSEQWLNTAPSQRVAVTAPANVDVVIEGERVKSGYEGRYFPDIELTADIAAEHRRGLYRLERQRPPHSGSRSAEVQGRTATRRSKRSSTTTSRTRRRCSRRHVIAASAIAPPVARAVWRTIPAGESWMGCVPGDDRCDEAENPRVRSTFARPFEMLDREVSADDFRAFAAASSRQMPRQPEWYADGTHPVVNVTWDEATAYCEWAGGRLPTEAEWEHAARGGLDGKLFPWGDEFTGQANGRHNLKTEQFDFTAPVASFPPNAFGLHDMAGNVWEWTASAFTLTHAAKPAERRLRPSDHQGRRMGQPHFTSARVRARGIVASGRHNLYVGFRCVR